MTTFQAKEKHSLDSGNDSCMEKMWENIIRITFWRFVSKVEVYPREKITDSEKLDKLIGKINRQEGRQKVGN